MCYLYKITNNLNGKAYIGWTGNYKVRWAGHRTQGFILTAAIKKYGWDNFTKEVLVVCPTEAYAKDAEIKAIQAFGTHYSAGGYNITFGGEGQSGIPMKPGHLEKMLEARKHLPHPRGMAGKHHTAGRNQYMSDHLKTLEVASRFSVGHTPHNKGKEHLRGKPGRQISCNGTKYQSVREAARQLGVHPSTLEFRIKNYPEAYFYTSDLGE